MTTRPLIFPPNSWHLELQYMLQLRNILEENIFVDNRVNFVK